jgi:ketosteroid isomerase-like protein
VSPENVELIHAVYAAMNRRDMAALQELADAHPDYEWRNGPDMPEPGLRSGAESTLGYVEDLFDTFDRINTVVREVIDPAGAIFVVRHHVRGAASGAEVERDEVHLWRTENDRVVGLDEFLTVEDAREAAAGV